MRFSIIMPVYNCEKYLEKSILSIINQSYKNWELILIDDGSNDNSPSICDEYLKKDNRITVRHIKNKGPSNARNLGVKQSKNEYIIFIDSDDFLEENALSILNNELEKKEYDIIFYPNYNEFMSDNTVRKTDNILYRKEYLNNSDFKADFINLINHYYIFPVWNKCYRRKFIIENDAIFPVGVLAAEDFVFNMSLYPKISLGLIIDKPLYHYVSRKMGSICTTFNSRRIESVKEVYEKCLPVIKNWIPEYVNQFNNFFITDINVCINNLFNHDSNISFFEKRKIVKKIVEDVKIRTCLKETKLIGLRNLIVGNLILFKQVSILMIISKIIRIIKR